MQGEWIAGPALRRRGFAPAGGVKPVNHEYLGSDPPAVRIGVTNGEGKGQKSAAPVRRGD